MKRKIVLSLLITLVLSMSFYTLVNSQKEGFEQRRTRVLDELSSAIRGAEEIGKYRCCIEPPCTMCYLGEWIWKDGSCYCDDMIVKGEFDKVCPQCKKGIEEGRCISTDKTGCQI